MGTCQSQAINKSLADYALSATNKRELATARLLTAINTSHVEEIKACVAEGADLNWHCGAPLRYAITNCHIKIVKLLLELGADPVLVIEEFYGPEITTLLEVSIINREIDILGCDNGI